MRADRSRKTGPEHIRTCLERNARAVSLRPSVGQGTAVTRVRLVEGLRCEVEEGPWKLTVDMSEKSGGTNEGPNPGTCGRASLGSCLAVGYAMWAARLGVPLARLEVEIQADYDVRGKLGVSDDVSPGYGEVRYVVTVESEAPEAEVRRVLDTADRYSSYRDIWARPIPLVRETRVASGSEMVEAVRAEVTRRGLGQVESARMDAEALEVPDGAFDAALCGLGLMYCPDPGKALSEMGRALRPDGRAAVAVWGARKRCGWAEIFPIVDARVETEVCPLFFQLGAGETLAATMREAGLVEVRAERLSVGLRYGGPEEAIDAAFAGGPVALAYARFDENTREEAHGEYLASIEPYRGGAGYEIPGEFVVAIGWKR